MCSSGYCETGHTKYLKQDLRVRVIWTERALSESQQVAEQLLRLRVLAALRGSENARLAAETSVCSCSVPSRRVIWTRGLVLDVHGLGVLALP